MITTVMSAEKTSRGCSHHRSASAIALHDGKSQGPESFVTLPVAHADPVHDRLVRHRELAEAGEQRGGTGPQCPHVVADGESRVQPESLAASHRVEQREVEGVSRFRELASCREVFCRPPRVALADPAAAGATFA